MRKYLRIALTGMATLAITLSSLFWGGPTPARALTIEVTNTNNSGTGSLAAAIVAANLNAGQDTITFNIPGGGVKTINLTSALPPLTDPVIINGLSQPGSSCAAWPPTLNIVLNGSGIPGGIFPVNGLYFTSGSEFSQVTGLVIQAFSGAGIGTDMQGLTVKCNYLGTDAAGTVDVGNAYVGIGLINALNTTIGGPNATDRNLISGNDEGGIAITINGGTAENNLIQNNYIGLTANGTGALANSRNGVLILDGANNNTVDGNVIGANTGDGVDVKNSIGTQIINNTIGFSAGATTPRGNGENGIELDGATDTIVNNNIIANNTQRGIAVVNTSAGNTFRQNRIFANTALGIDLNEDGVTANDAGDSDTGPNGRQNFPIISTFTKAGSNFTITGTLNSAANQTYRVEFFSSPTCDASGNGEGTHYLGAQDVLTNGSGNGTFNVTFAAGSPSDLVVTATAEGTDGTSEFSACKSPPTPNPDGIGVWRNSAARFYLRNALSAGAVNFNIPIGLNGDIPVVGDWNGDGIATIGVWRPTNRTFYLKNANTAAAPIAIQFSYGLSTDIPVAGDWDGDGVDSIGVWRPANGIFYLRNALSVGAPTYTVRFGLSTDRPFVGDWNGDKADSPGVFRPSNTRMLLSNTVCANCTAAISFNFVYGQTNDLPIAGDWDGDGTDSTGIFRAPTFLLRNALSGGAADFTFNFGLVADRPVAGRWVAPVPDVAPSFVPRD